MGNAGFISSAIGPAREFLFFVSSSPCNPQSAARPLGLGVQGLGPIVAESATKAPLPSAAFGRG